MTLNTENKINGGGTDMKNSKIILKQIEEISARLEKIDRRVEKIDQRVEKIDQRVDKIDKRVDKIDMRMDAMNSRLNKVENRTRDIQLTIENDIRQSISFVAEGHLDLSRKLDKALENERNKEILEIRNAYMENEIRRIKEKMEEPA